VPTGGSPDRAALGDEEDRRKINVSCTIRSIRYVVFEREVRARELAIDATGSAFRPFQ
jgi:hypothetical protein